jgi:hypothetical protein
MVKPDKCRPRKPHDAIPVAGVNLEISSALEQLAGERYFPNFQPSGKRCVVVGKSAAVLE